MFIGHYAVALAAKRAVPKVSLGTTVFAAGLLDFVWPVLLLADVEHFRIAPGVTRVTPLDFHDYPYSHSLAFVLGWSVLFGGVHFALKRDKWAAWVLGTLVFSHWACDVIVHRPDLPVLPGGPYLGLGLWNSLPGTIALEGAMFAAGVWIYARMTAARDGVGRWAFWSLIGCLVAIYVGNLFGPPPPNESVVAWMGVAQLLMVAWIAWADRHRNVTLLPAAEGPVAGA
jgi:FtsH-binding integral membrane protein